MARKDRKHTLREFGKAGPDQSTVYVDQELTEMSTGWFMDPEAREGFAHTVFPDIDVDKQSGTYRTYDASSSLRNKMERRADGGESAGAGFETSTAQFSTDVWAWHIDIGPQTRTNARGSVDVDSVATYECVQAALINREVEWVSTYFKTGVWSTEVVFAAVPAGAQRLSWADDDSDPVGDLLYALDLQEAANLGKRANSVVFSQDVWNRLRVHPAMRALWAGSNVSTGTVIMQNMTRFKQQLAEVLEVDQIKVAKGYLTTSEDGNPTSTYGRIVPTGVLLTYAPATPSLLSPSAGYTVNWTGYLAAGGAGETVTREIIPLTRGATRYEIEQAYGFIRVTPQAGAWFQNVLAT